MQIIKRMLAISMSLNGLFTPPDLSNPLSATVSLSLLLRNSRFWRQLQKRLIMFYSPALADKAVNPILIQHWASWEIKVLSFVTNHLTWATRATSKQWWETIHRDKDLWLSAVVGAVLNSNFPPLPTNCQTMGLPAHETIFWVFRFKLHCLQIFSLKHRISGVEYGKTTMSSDLQMLKFGSSNLQS